MSIEDDFREALRLLRLAEFSSHVPWGDTFNVCPVCVEEWGPDANPREHRPGCSLAALLARFPEAKSP